MVVLNLYQTLWKKYEIQAVKGGATRPQFETYTIYCRVGDGNQEKKSQAVLIVVF